MKKGKILKYIAVILLTLILGIGLYFYIGFFGNPISKVLANHSAEKYMAENYPNCYIENVGYNFKDGRYFANIQKEESIDTNFFVYFDWLGNVTYDAYESYVTKGHNTVNRMFMEYRALLDEIITPDSVDFTIDILYGDILTEYYGKDTSILPADEITSMPMEEVVVDKQYDYTELGYKYGYVCLYACDEDVSVERACEILLDVKEKLDKNNIGFKYIDFVLQKPRQADGMLNQDESRVHVNYFNWDDIYEEGLWERVQTAHDLLTEYYAEMDAQKTAEIMVME
ncbi:MAG: hypothetical protein IKU54_01015 [Oscillospiraceae bacterium]|nr:hypothetical protein [Oscillospiraceae bacterium]